MRKPGRACPLLVFSVVALSASFWVKSAAGQNTPNVDALRLITAAAEEMCASAPLQASNEINLSGAVKAKLNAIITKLIDLRISSASAYKSATLNGILQRDLIGALQYSADCRLAVFQTLQSSLLTLPVDDSLTIPSTNPIHHRYPTESGNASTHAPALTPTRDFLTDAEIPPLGVGAYGIVALRAKPGIAVSRDRINMLCLAYLSSLPGRREIPATIPNSQQMITIWPIDDLHAVTSDESNCRILLDHYSLFSGLAAIRDASSQGQDMTGRGPFLIGWSPSNSRYEDDAVVLVIDMSDFDTQASFNEALLFWQRKIIENPSLWRDGFSLNRLRLALRDFVDHYGNDIVKAVRIGD